MQKKEKNPFVYMVSQKNKNGFTFITTIMMMSIIVLTLPFLSYALQIAQPESNFDEIAMNEFFRFVRNEIMRSQSVYVENNTLYLVQEIIVDDEKHKEEENYNEFSVASISQYYSVVRRQVNGLGHEIYLRDVEDIIFKKNPYNLNLMITDLKGNRYEKNFALYNEK